MPPPGEKVFRGSGRFAKKRKKQGASKFGCAPKPWDCGLALRPASGLNLTVNRPLPRGEAQCIRFGFRKTFHRPLSVKFVAVLVVLPKGRTSIISDLSRLSINYWFIL